MISSGTRSRIQDLAAELLLLIGEDPNRPGLIKTPRRFADFWVEFVDYSDNNTNTTFEAISVDQLVVVKDIRVWSLCEHHLLPFWCDIAIGYLAADRVLGLSKFARIAHKNAHRLQLQERLVRDIAEEVVAAAGSDNVAVIGSGVHTCMSMRGIRAESTVQSSVTYGSFREDSALRAEFLRLAGYG